MRDPSLEFHRGRRVLVTGGTGSIGSQIVEQLLGASAEAVCVLSRDETKQLELRERLGERFDLRRARFLTGDVRDPARLRRAMEGVEIVFHAAAMKHVSKCEHNPLEAVQTNVLGTQNVITSARDAGVERVVVISTDKATSPESAMGATKLLAEKLVSTAHVFSSGPKLCAVRFGNVIGSRGSLAPRVIVQLEREGCASLTHPEMTRFMMTIRDAVSVVLEAASRARGGETFVPKMPALRVRDLLRALVEEYAASVGRSPEDFPIRTIGVRPGERLHESLITDDERRRTRLVRDGLFVVEAAQVSSAPAEFQELARHLDSSRGPFLDAAAIRGLLLRAGVLPLSRASTHVAAAGLAGQTAAPS